MPYNPFGYYKVSIPNNAKIVDAAKITTKDLNESKLNEFNAVISTGELLTMPAGGVGFAFGADIRHEQLNQYPDPYAATGDLIGSSPTANTQGQRKVAGVFAEVQLPLLKNAPAAHDLSMSVAGRYENFLSTKQTTTVPKIGVRWQPIDESLTIRASWSKGFRQPSLYELYSTPTSGLTPIIHPVTGVNEPEQSVTVAGNRRLAPERTKYTNAGVIWSPQADAIKGLTLSVDYWEAERTGTVSNNYQDTVNRYFGHAFGGAAAPGGMLPGESVVLFPDGSINVINSVFFNVGLTKAAGFDYGARYVIHTDNMGRIELGAEASMYTHYKVTTVAGTPLTEIVSQPTPEGTGSDNGYLKWKGRAQVQWAYKGYSALFGGNYLDGFWDVDGNTGNDFFVKTTWIFDAQVAYSLHSEMGPWLADTKITLGVRNLFDKDPPFASGNAGNSTGYPSFLYTSEGRFWYVSLDRKF
jgi:iron complex outermembrane receptor protein